MNMCFYKTVLLLPSKDATKSNHHIIIDLSADLLVAAANTGLRCNKA